MTLKSYILILASAAVALASGFLLGRHQTPDTVYVTVPEVQVRIDTVFVRVPSPPKVVVKAIHDTVLVAFDGNPEEFKLSAWGGTGLIADGVNYGYVGTEYIYPPWDEFEFDFQPAPLPTVTKTITEVKYLPSPCVRKWYENPYLWFAGTTAVMYVAYRTAK